jgi:ABC-type tungstate transport system substrate-binding protein
MEGADLASALVAGLTGAVGEVGAAMGVGADGAANADVTPRARVVSKSADFFMKNIQRVACAVARQQRES